jgi:hypothetical protein
VSTLRTALTAAWPVILAAGLIATAFVVALRLRHYYRTRQRGAAQASREPVHPVAAAWAVPLRALRGLVTRRRPAVHPDQGVPHEGATEKFGDELHALRDMEPSPELVSDIETELAWGLIWHNFEAELQAEVARIFAPALALAECEDFDEVRELIGLDADDRELVPA